MTQKLKLLSPVGADPLILKWPIATSEGKDGPEEILDTIKLVCEDFPELKAPLDTRILKDGEDVSSYDYEQTKAMCERYNKAIDSVRLLAKGTSRQKSVNKQVSMKQLKHILQQCYNHSVKDPEKLNHYEPFSPEVYGETSFELVEQMIKYVKFTDSDYFIDLGSGVGQVVLQVSAATNCKFCYGVEKAEWPADYAVGMEKEFRKWMKWYGKDHGEFKIEKGDFLHDAIKEKLNKATIVFVNNFAFGPVVDHELKQRFANCLKEGARIVSSKAFCPMNFRITARNLSDIGTIMQVEELSPLCGAVSWTGKPFAYYVHTIDRTLLEKYFQRLRYPSQKQDEVELRKDRKGRPLLSIRDKINGALSAKSDSAGRWRRGKGLLREGDMASPLSAAKVLDFDSGSNSSSTVVTEDNTIVYGPTTRRQWNEYVKRPQSGTENENDSSTADAMLEVKTKDQAKQITQKKKRMKTVKRLNNGALGKRQMQVGKKKAEQITTVKSKAAVKLRPRQKKVDGLSLAPRRAAAAASAASTAASISTTTTTTMSSNHTAHTNSSALAPSLDSLNLLHAHTIMSTSGKDPAEKVSYNDRRMTETSSAYFKPTVQKQTVPMLEKEAGFLQMIETMKLRFLSYLTFMQTPEYRAMLLLQIEQEKRKNATLKNQVESLEKDVSLHQKEGVKLIKDRLKEMGVKADTPRELISQAKDIVLRHQELKSQTASLGAQINALQAEHNHKITTYRKVLDRKNAFRHQENGFYEHTYHMVDRERFDQQKLLANINRLYTELQHLQNVNRPYVSRSENGCLDLGLGPESKGVLKTNGALGPAYTYKEKLDMKENYDAIGSVLALVKKEVTTAIQNNQAPPAGGVAVKLDARQAAAPQNVNTRQETTDRTQTGNIDLKSSNQPWCPTEVIVRNTGSNVQSVKEQSTKMSQMPASSSWTSDVRSDAAITSTSPRILPPGMKIDIKKPSRLNGLSSTLKTKAASQPTTYSILQNPDCFVNQTFKANVNGGLGSAHTLSSYTENEKSAAEDLISLKESLSSPTAGIEPQGTPLKTVSSSSSLPQSLPGMDHIQSHLLDLKSASRKHSPHDDKPTILIPNNLLKGSNSKDFSVSCAITPATSTSHVFAQPPIVNHGLTGSSSRMVGQSSQLSGTIIPRQGRTIPVSGKVKIVASMTKNGLVKHKSSESLAIQRPIKVRTLDLRNDSQPGVPTVVSSSFQGQSQQVAQILQSPSLGSSSGASLAHMLKSESGHLVSSQSFLNAHMGGAIVSCGSSHPTGSASLPFVTIQSASQGGNGVQPSLLKMLQQKPLVITSKNSTIFNGSSSSNTGSVISVSPTITTQGTIAQAESLGQTVKILPPNGDAKGCLRSTGPCSLVVSEFDAYVHLASPEPKHKCRNERGQQAMISDSDSESSGDASERAALNKNCLKDCAPGTRKRQTPLIARLSSSGQENWPSKVSRLSSDSEVSSSENMYLAIATPTLIADTEPILMEDEQQDSSSKRSSNNLSVILKREARLEQMVECITGGGSAQDTSVLKVVQCDAKESNFSTGSNLHNKSGIQDKQSGGIVNEKNLRHKDQINHTNVVFRTRRISSKLHQVSSNFSSASPTVHLKTTEDKAKIKSESQGQQDSSTTDKGTKSESFANRSHHISRKDSNHVSRSHRHHQKESQHRNKAVYEDDYRKDNSAVLVTKPKDTRKSVLASTELPRGKEKKSSTDRAHSTGKKSAPVHKDEEHQIKCNKNVHLSKSKISDIPSSTDEKPSMVKTVNNHYPPNSDSHKSENKLLKSKPCRLTASHKLGKKLKHKPCEKNSRDLSKAEISKPVENRTSSKGYKRHVSHKPSRKPEPASRTHTREWSNKAKIKATDCSRNSKYSESRHKNSEKWQFSKEMDMSPGPPKLERAVSPDDSLKVQEDTSRMSTPVPQDLDIPASVSDNVEGDLPIQFCENCDRSSHNDHKQGNKCSTTANVQKASSFKDSCRSSKPSLSPKESSKQLSRSEKKVTSSLKSIRHLTSSHRVTKNSKFGSRVPATEGTRDQKPSNNIRYNRSHKSSTHKIMSDSLENSSKVTSDNQLKCNGSLDTQDISELNNELFNKNSENYKFNSEVGICRELSVQESLEDINKNEHKDKDKTVAVDPAEINSPIKPGNCDASVKTAAEYSTQSEADNMEPSSECPLFTILDSPYGMLTPKSMSQTGQAEEDKNSDSSGGESLQLKENRFQTSHQKIDNINIRVLENELFPFPPTPSKTPRSHSNPNSPCPEANSQASEEPNEMLSGESETCASVKAISVCLKKGPQTPPGSPLFNHHSRSRSPSVSSSSSRVSSCDSCHSSSSSSSCSDSSSGETKRRKQHHYRHHKTPPRKLSSLIPAASLGIGSPPKAAVLYSPLPNTNINSFNYGVHLRMGLGPTSAPLFPSHGMLTGSSVLSPLSVATQQSPGYQMVTSDTLRSPNGLMRSPVSGALRQPPFFPNTLLSPVVTAVPPISTSSPSNAIFKDSGSGLYSISQKPAVMEDSRKQSEPVQIDTVQKLKLGTTELISSTTRSLVVTPNSDSTGLASGLHMLADVLPKSLMQSYKELNSSEIIRDHNANNTTLVCSHSSSDLQGVLTSVDFNQNLCQLSAPYCSKSTLSSTTSAVSATGQVISEELQNCSGGFQSHFSASGTEVKGISEDVSSSSYSNQGSFENLVIEKDTFHTSIIPSFRPPTTLPFTSTLTVSTDCIVMDSLVRSMEIEHRVAQGKKTDESYLPCSLIQHQSVQYLSSSSHQPNNADQSRQPTQHTKQLAQPLQHLPLCHPASSPLVPQPQLHKNLPSPRSLRQKSPVNSSHIGQDKFRSQHSYKAHFNQGNRRPTFVSQLPVHHYQPHHSSGNPQGYLGFHPQNTTPYMSKARHKQSQGPHTGFRDLTDGSLINFMNGNIMDYSFHGVSAQPGGSPRWDHPTHPYCVGAGPGNLGRSFSQQYNHFYHKKHHY